MAQKNKIDGATKFFIATIGLVVIALVLKELSNIFIPLVIAIFLFFVFSPFNTWLSNKKIPMFIITLIDIIITLSVLYVVGKIVVDSFTQFAEGLPAYGNKLSNMIRGISVSLGLTDPFFTNFSFDQLLARLDIENIAGGIFSSTFSLLGTVLFVLFFFVFVLSGNETIYKAIEHRYVFKKVSPELKNIKKNLHHTEGTVDEQKLLDEFHYERTLREQQLETTFKKITEQIQRYILAKVGVNIAAGIITAIVIIISRD